MRVLDTRRQFRPVDLTGATIWCSDCAAMRPAEDFRKRKTYCRAHAAARAAKLRGGYKYGPRDLVADGATVKRCGRCKTMLPISAFYPRRRDDPTTLKGVGHCRACQKEKRFAGRQEKRDRMAQNRRQLGEEIFAAYGTKCACCGEATRAFLTIDHIQNNGAVHRREIGGGNQRTSNTYFWLKAHGFPPGFQTLCRNCNWAKHLLGRCPHEMLAAVSEHEPVRTSEPHGQTHVSGPSVPVAPELSRTSAVTMAPSSCRDL